MAEARKSPAELALRAGRGQRVFAQVQPRVEDGLTERGRALLPLLVGLHVLGAADPPAAEAGE